MEVVDNRTTKQENNKKSDNKLYFWPKLDVYNKNK